MKRIRTLSAVAVAVALALASAAAAAADRPTQASVTITNVSNDIAHRIDVDPSQIPLNVTVPMEVAAAVCGLLPDVLAQHADAGVAQCTAQRTTSELDNVVLRQVKGNAGK